MARFGEPKKEPSEMSLVDTCLVLARWAAIFVVFVLPMSITAVGGIWPASLAEGGFLWRIYEAVMNLAYGPVRLPDDRRPPGAWGTMALLWVVAPFALAGVVALSRYIALRIVRRSQPPEEEP